MDTIIFSDFWDKDCVIAYNLHEGEMFNYLWCNSYKAEQFLHEFREFGTLTIVEWDSLTSKVIKPCAVTRLNVNGSLLKLTGEQYGCYYKNSLRKEGY